MYKDERKAENERTTEKEKMLNGRPYKAFDKKLSSERTHARELTFEYNNLHPGEINKRNVIITTAKEFNSLHLSSSLG
jgi:hypothetical protein